MNSRTSPIGSWLAVLGPELTVLLPGREKSRAAELWAAVDEGALFEDVLDLLVAGGLADVPQFVLVHASGSSARVLVRGGASITVHSDAGPVEVAAGDRVWAEESFSQVTSVHATLPDSDARGEPVPVSAGLVRVGSMVWGAARQPEPQQPEPQQPEFQSESQQPEPRQPEAPRAPEPVPAPAASATASPPVPAAGAAAAAAVPPVGPLPPVAPAMPTVPSLPTVPPVSVPRLVGDRSPEQVAAETGEQPVLDPAAAATEQTTEHDGLTQMGGSPDAPTPLGIPGQPQAPSVTSRPVARLVFSHGTTAEVDRAILIGRAPEARRFAPGDQPQLVSVPSPSQEVSSTHLEIRPGSGVDHGMAIATDLGSTNGTLLMQPGLPPEDLQPGIAVSLSPGAIIDLGDGVTIQVTKP